MTQNLNNCVCIGHNTGTNLIEAEGPVLIGDDILDLNTYPDGTLCVGNYMRVGEYVLGQKCNLREILLPLSK